MMCRANAYVPWHRCRHWEYAFDEERVDPDDPDRELTREELAAVMIDRRLQEEIAKLPPELRHTTPPIPADFLEMMTWDILIPDFRCY